MKRGTVITMDKTWKKMYQLAQSAQNYRQISAHMEAGGVAAAVNYGKNLRGRLY